jgi:hypothetical protein
MRLAAGFAPVAMKRRAVNRSTKVRTSLYMKMECMAAIRMKCLMNLDQIVSRQNLLQ